MSTKKILDAAVVGILAGVGLIVVLCGIIALVFSWICGEDVDLDGEE